MRIAAALAAILACMPCAARADTPPPYVAAAVADHARARDAKLDARRHPTELAVFAGIKPGDTVVDLIPGGGYFTRVFSQIVGPTGHVYAIWPTEYAAGNAEDVAALKAVLKDARYANVTVLTQPAGKLSVPTPADVVWTSQNYHDYPDRFMGPTDPAVLDAAVAAALKPGGVFVVVDHAAQPGSGARDTETLHRIDAALVKTQVVAAGLLLDGESDVLHNASDTHKRPVFDAAIRGHTDQFVLRFRKPAR